MEQKIPEQVLADCAEIRLGIWIIFEVKKNYLAIHNEKKTKIQDQHIFYETCNI